MGPRIVGMIDMAEGIKTMYEDQATTWKLVGRPATVFDSSE